MPTTRHTSAQSVQITLHPSLYRPPKPR
jgi:hypothetical protein